MFELNDKNVDERKAFEEIRELDSDSDNDSIGIYKEFSCEDFANVQITCEVDFDRTVEE